MHLQFIACSHLDLPRQIDIPMITGLPLLIKYTATKNWTVRTGLLNRYMVCEKFIHATAFQTGQWSGCSRWCTGSPPPTSPPPPPMPLPLLLPCPCWLPELPMELDTRESTLAIVLAEKPTDK